LSEQSGVVPEWNFYKYLVNHEGKVVGAWGPKTSVESILPQILPVIREAQLADAAGDVPKKKVDFHYKLEPVDPGLVDYDLEEESQDAHQDYLKDEL
jgi:hypothetical protein